MIRYDDKYKKNELYYTEVINKALSVKNSQDELNLYFSNQKVKYKEYCLLCRLIFESISRITTSKINIDFSKNNIEKKVFMDGSDPTYTHVSIVVEGILEKMSNKNKLFDLNINFEDTDITMYSVVKIIDDMKKWRENKYLRSMDIKLNYGDVIKNTMTPDQLDTFAMFQNIKNILKWFEHVKLDANSIYVGNTEIKISYQTNIKIELTNDQNPVYIKGIYTNLDDAYTQLISSKGELNKIFPSKVIQIISEFAFNSQDDLNAENTNIQNDISVEGTSVLEKISLGLQITYTYIKLLKASTSLAIEDVLPAGLAVIQFKASINIYKNSYSYDKSSYLLGVVTVINVFYELYNENYVNMFTPFIMPTLIVATKLLSLKEYSNSVDNAIEYIGYMFTGLSVAAVINNAYKLYQEDVNGYNMMMVGALITAAIKLPTPAVVIAAIIATPSAAIYKYYNDQQTTAINEEPKEMSGIIEDLSYQHDEF